MRASPRPHLLLFALLLPACELSAGKVVARDHAVFPDGILRVVIDNGAGDVIVTGDAERTEASWVVRGSSTHVKTWVDGTDLHLRATCRTWRRCSVDWIVDVPADVGVQVDTGSGDVALDDLAGAAVFVSTGSGDIDAAGLSVPRFTADTGSGDIGGEALTIVDVDVDSGSGDVELGFDAPPAALLVHTGSGDLDVSVPAGRYALSLRTGSGDKHVDGITSDAHADNRLDLRTGSGDIRVAGR